MRFARLIFLAVFAAAALPAATAFAQYPEPVGVCTVTPNAASVAPNSVATFTVSTRTATGNPAPNVSGTVSVASGQGTVLTPTFTTGAGGTAQVSVQTGANPGQLSLRVTCGALATTGVVSVVSSSGTVVQPKPPDTGLGTESGSSSLPFAWILAGIALVGAAGAASATVAIRRR
jgi:hypothetical protein